jgi:hypothetical protein
MERCRIDFGALPWQETAAGARHKAVERDGKRLRLVEFTVDFVEADWCLRGHVGYLLEGELEIEFGDLTERFRPGDGLMIRGHGEQKHKARAIGATAKLLLVDDA